MQDKPDWFKLYPALFLQDTIVDAMTTEELGATVRLLCRQWMDGHIPDDMDLVGRLCRMNRSAIEQAWPILCQFFPEIEPGKRANRYMWIERETVVSAMAKKRNDGRDAVTKRWDAIRALKGTNRSPIPDLIQEQETEEEKNKSTPLPPKRGLKAKRRSWTDVDEYTDATREVVNALMPIWPKKQPDETAINCDQFKMADRIQELLANPALTAEMLIEGAKQYLSTCPKKFKAPQFFFGPGMGDDQPAWRPYVAAQYRVKASNQ